jgi:glycosyltransferase involved in cell wall biosynthesis
VNILVSPDGVDLARYKNLPDPIEARAFLRSISQWPMTNYPLTIGYTGHLYQGRGVEHILKIATKLPEIHFLLVGGNPEDISKLQAQISNTQSPVSNISIIGFIPNADLPLYQAACDLLLMPYQRHVAASSGGDIAPYLSPMKLFEYLAAGRTILSSNLPVFREVLNAQNAVLLPPDDINAWIAAIHDLQADPGKRAALGTRARQDAEKYTWEARAQKILDGLG